MHQAAYEFVEECVRALHQRGSAMAQVVEFGGQDVNETNLGLRVRDNLFPNAEYLTVDIFPGPGVDVVADAADWRTDRLWDVVVCCETLEHTPRGKDIVDNAYRFLKGGGMLILTCATDPRAVHGAATDLPKPGEYYGNVSPGDMNNWLRGWDDVHIECHPQGDMYVCAVKPR